MNAAGSDEPVERIISKNDDYENDENSIGGLPPTRSPTIPSLLPDPSSHSQQPRLRLTFNIRFAAEGTIPDLLNVWVGDRESVRDFKYRVQLLRPTLAMRRLRLIYMGRVLTDGTLLVPWTELLLQRQSSHLSQTETVTRALGDAVSGALGAVKGGYDAAIGVKNKGKGKEIESGYGSGQNPCEAVVWLQCAVGEAVSQRSQTDSGDGDQTNPGEEADATEEPDDLAAPPLPRPLTGFDRLAEAGFSEEDIEQVRRQFHAEHTLMGLQSINDPNFQGDADEEEHARAMEEQWLEGLNSTQDGVDSGLGSQIYTTLFKGLCIGFFFPILPIFFFRTEIMDRRTQLAVLSGTAINFLFAQSEKKHKEELRQELRNLKQGRLTSDIDKRFEERYQ